MNKAEKRKVYFYLKNKYDLKGIEIAEITGRKPPIISRYSFENESIPDEVIELLAESKNENIDNILKEIDSNSITLSEPTSNYGKKSGVPFFPNDVTGSIVSSFNDIKEQPEYFIDFKPFNDCDAWLTIYGDSMYPNFASGEMVAVKRVHNVNVLLWGESYLVVTSPEANNLRTIKLVYQHEKDNKVILRASNPNFKGDTVIEKEHILSMWSVKGKVTRKQL